MSEFSVPLETIMPCFQGVFPSWVTTCSADGVPNTTIVSIVHYVDSERVALTRQFMNKSRINLDENPQAQVIVVNPANGDQFALDLHYLRTESEGPIFDAVETNLDAIASMTGMTGVFRLRGVDIHSVLACEPFGGSAPVVAERRVERDMLPLLDEFIRRLSVCTEYADAVRVGLEALDDLFGFGYSVLLTADERGDRLFAVASNGYLPSGVGAEVPIGYGPIGITAQRRRVVCIPSMTRSRSMNAAIQDSIRRSGGEASDVEIALPGLERVDSVAAVPLVAHDELTGVLFLESERAGDFGPGNQRLLRILGGHLAGVLAVLQADRGESAPPEPAPAKTPGGEPLAVTYYQADDSVFVDGAYVVKGVPGPDSVEAASRARRRRSRLVHQPGAAARRAASGCRPATTTSKRVCSCCASVWRCSSVGSDSTASAAVCWRCMSARRASSARCRRRVRCAPLTRPPDAE